MKLKFISALLLFLNIALSQPKKWTVMVYMNADNNLERYGISDFLEMADVPNSNDVNVLVQMDRTPEETPEYGNWTQTLRFKMRQGMEPEYKEKLIDLKEQNMGDPKVLRDFINWCKANYPAEKYILIIWDHGDGWRFQESKSLTADVKARYISEYRQQLATQLAQEQKKDDGTLLELNAQIASLNSDEFLLTDSYNTTALQFTSLPVSFTAKADTTTDFSLLKGAFSNYMSANFDSIPKSQYPVANEYVKTLNDLTTKNLEIADLESQVKALANKQYLVPNDFAKNLKLGTVDKEPVKAVSHDDTNNDVLYNREIQDILVDNEVDIIGFDACLMSMLETGYALKDKTGFLVGSEELEPGDGWNYSKWLSKLVGNPSMTAEDLSKVIVASYAEEYASKKDVTLSAINVKLIPEYGKKVSELATTLTAGIETFYPAIVGARSLCNNYAPGYANVHSIDFPLFLVHLVTRTNDVKVRELYEQLTVLGNSMVVANFRGKARGYKPGVASFGSFGLAIYFPLPGSIIDPAYTDANNELDNVTNPKDKAKEKAKNEVQFVRDFKWDEMLQAYLNFHQ